LFIIVLRLCNTLLQHFSNYFVQILVIRSKCQGDKDGPGEERKNSELSQLCCHSHSLLLFLIPIKRKENSSCSACGHHLQDLTHLPLDCLASEPLGAPYLTPLLPFLTSGPDLGVWSGCWVSVEFFHPLISRKGSASTTITNHHQHFN